jgi:hypothetical protein
MLTYRGSFLAPPKPANTAGEDPFSFGGRLAWDRTRQQLAMMGRDGRWGYLGAAEPNTIAPLDGPLHAPPPRPDGDGSYTGLLLDGGQAVLTSWTIYYDADNVQRVGHFYNGQWRAFLNPLMQGYVAGYMAWVPERWKADLGDVILGQCGIPIVSRTSAGPSAFALGFDGLWAQPLVYYPLDHALAGYESNSELFNQTMQIVGCAIVGDELIFAGTIGVGTPCYGIGTADPAKDGQTINGEHFCYDPEASAKGGHQYPYRFQLWVYQIADLLDLTKQPWEKRPTIEVLDRTWFAPTRTWLAGFTADEQGRLYLSQAEAENSARVGGYPIVHVIDRAVEASPQPEPIPAPDPLEQENAALRLELAAYRQLQTALRTAVQSREPQ